MDRVRVMDWDTAEHFYAWLDKNVADEDQDAVEDSINALLENDMDLLKDHSWPELRSLAERKMELDKHTPSSTPTDT